MPERFLLSLGALALAAPLLACALPATHPAAASARRPQAVDPPSGQLTVVSINGTGCRAGTTQVRPRATTGLDITFRALQARQGGGASAADRRAACVAAVNADVPGGYTLGVGSVVLRGRAALSAGTTGTAGVRFWFVGQPNTGDADRRVTGPLNGGWELRHTVPASRIAWAPCRAGRPVNLSVDVRVGGRQSTARNSMTVDTAAYGFVWRRC